MDYSRLRYTCGMPPPLRAFFNTLADALFPVHPAEQAVLGMDVTRLFASLPRAPFAPIHEACSIFAYKDERVCRLVWCIKYKKSRKGAALAGFALNRMLHSFAQVVPEDVRVLVVPMPIAPARRRQRGYNQCELILDEIERLDVGQLIFSRDLLVRVRHTSRQTLKDRRERLASIQDIFAVDEKALERFRQIGPEKFFVVVIDDVITTGSTMRNAIGALRQAGFKNAYGLSLAH